MEITEIDEIPKIPEIEGMHLGEGMLEAIFEIAEHEIDFEDVSNTDLYKLRGEDLKLYFNRIRSGDKKAKDAFVLAHMGLVKKIVLRNCRVRGKQYSDDLINEGVVGICIALEKFNPDLGVPFYGYAAWWIEAYVKIYLDKDKVVQPVLKDSLIMLRIRNFKDKFLANEGREPTLDEIAHYLGFTVKKVNTILKRASLFEFVPLSIANFSDPDEIDKLIEGIDNSEKWAILNRAFEKLPEREKKFLIMRFGLSEGSEPLTLDQIGDVDGITKERVRQIVERSLNRLKKIIKIES